MKFELGLSVQHESLEPEDWDLSEEKISNLMNEEGFDIPGIT